DRAMKESTAYIITDMLKDVINEGTATPVQIPTVIQAGKTGTSNYADDAWDKVKGDGVPDITFAGYTPKYSFAVWTGYDDYFTPIPLYSQQLAMDIYRNYMTFLYQNLEATDWKQPDDVVRSGREVYLKDFVGSQNTKTSKSVSSSSTETSSTTSKSSTSEAPKESESTPVTPPPTSETVPPSTSSDVTPPTETTPSETTPPTGTNPPTSSSGPPEGSEKPAG
ncbi:MAG: penicillin-binding protein, partial [Vagococcus fluvialis]